MLGRQDCKTDRRTKVRQDNATTMSEQWGVEGDGVVEVLLDTEIVVIGCCRDDVEEEFMGFGVRSGDCS